MKRSIIEIKGLHKSFNSFQVLQGVDLDIKRGETITILGGSGTGKSVLLKLIAGLEKPDQGQIHIDKRDIVPLQEDEVRRILGRVEERRDEEIIEIPYRVGDPVKVIDEPFTDFAGVVEEISKEKKKLKVLVSIFGRSTPVELDFLQVELEK